MTDILSCFIGTIYPLNLFVFVVIINIKERSSTVQIGTIELTRGLSTKQNGENMAKTRKKQTKKQKNPCNCGVGSRLRKVRVKNGHTVRFLAGVLNLEEDSYRRIEYGINSLSADKANVLHRKLGYDLNYIIGGTDYLIESECAATSDEVVIRMLSDVKVQLEVIEEKVCQKN